MKKTFNKVATANPVFFRTYSRRNNGKRENWEDVVQRTTTGLTKLGKLTQDESDLICRMQLELKSLTSGRWLWIGGTEWIEQPENFSGAYNCSSTNVDSWEAFGILMNLAMTGCGTGAVLESQYINQLPKIENKLNVTIQGEIGLILPEKRQPVTITEKRGNNVIITVGDSRQGWVKSYENLLKLSTDNKFGGEVNVTVDISHVRPAGEPLKGFGGVANPIKLKELYSRCTKILNKAVGRKLNSVECCLLIDEAALTVVAGNIRRSAGLKQADKSDVQFANAKQNMWQVDSNGNWKIDPDKDALRMSNHTRIYHQKPTLEECVEAVTSQYYTGEGAIQWAGEAIARANADILNTAEKKKRFLEQYSYSKECGEIELIGNMEGTKTQKEINYRLGVYGLNPCGK